MRIHSDKIENGPPHGLCARDVRLILSRVPSGWIDGLRRVRLANGWHSPRAYFNQSEGCLTIYSRCGTKTEVLVALLSTLASPSLNILNVASRAPSEPEHHRLRQLIQPLVDELLPQMAAPTGLRSFVPENFLQHPNDPA